MVLEARGRGSFVEGNGPSVRLGQHSADFLPGALAEFIAGPAQRPDGGDRSQRMAQASKAGEIVFNITFIIGLCVWRSIGGGAFTHDPLSSQRRHFHGKG